MLKERTNDEIHGYALFFEHTKEPQMRHAPVHMVNQANWRVNRAVQRREQVYKKSEAGDLPGTASTQHEPHGCACEDASEAREVRADVRLVVLRRVGVEAEVIVLQWTEICDFRTAASCTCWLPFRPTRISTGEVQWYEGSDSN